MGVSTIEQEKKQLKQKEEELNQIDNKIKGKTEELREKENQLKTLEVLEKVDSPELQHLFQGGILLNKENISEYLSYPNGIDEGPWIYDPKEKYLYKLDGTLLFCHEEKKYNEDNEILRIPEGVTKIGDGAFKNSTYKKIHLPKSVSYIGKEAFLECEELEEITMPGAQTIENEAFNGCEKLQRINCPKVIMIGENAFDYCYNLKEISLPQCTEIQKEAFTRCSKLEKIYLPSIKKMGTECIDGNRDGIILYLGDQLKEIDPNALPDQKIMIISTRETFQKVKKVKNKYYLTFKEASSNQIQQIAPQNNEESSNPKEKIDFTHQKATIQQEIEQLGNEIKDLADNANRLRLDNNDKKQKIKELICNDILQTFNGPFTKIFKECTIIDKEIDKENIKNSFNDPYLLKALDTGPLLYHEKTGCIYNNAGELIRYFGKDTSFKIPEGVTKIGDGAFKNSTIKEVIIPDSVKEIGKSAFAGSNIEELTFPKGIKEISPSTCRGCHKLKTVHLPDTLETICNDAFRNCYELQELKIPASVISIGDYAFCYTTKLEYLSIPPSVTHIGKNVLEGTRLKKLILPKYCEKEERDRREDRGYVDDEHLIFDDKYAEFQSTLPLILSHEQHIKTTLDQEGTLSFDNNPQIIKKKTIGEEAKQKTREINIPHSVQFIEETTFRGRTNLEKVQLSNSMGEIPSFLFRECSNLKEITLPEHLIRIDEQAFCECENLKEIDIPETVHFIDERAFCCCTQLKEIKIPKATLGKNIFEECTNLTSIKLSKEMFTPENKIKQEYLIDGNKDLSIEELKEYLGLNGKCNIILE